MSTQTFRVPNLPLDFSWEVDPDDWELSPTGALSVTAGPKTDPVKPILNAPRAMGPAEGDFQFSVRVEVHHAETFDAGVMLAWVDAYNWGKLCFEYSPAGEPMIVSVVTRGVSDDCNSFVVDGSVVWLRLSRSARTFAFHASLDGHRWRLIRYFTLPAGPSILIGIEAQAPTGDRCTATFSDFRYVPSPVANIRDGN
jgi:regulation of enolase protein 1 (concanavalin A-like superfamily)